MSKGVATSLAISSRLKVRQLLLLEETASSGSLSKAAERLNISQPTATRLIHELEDTFDVPILDRNSRGVTLTKFGHVLLGLSRDFRVSLANTTYELEQLKSNAPERLSIGNSGSSLVPSVIIRLLDRRPNLQISVVDGTTSMLVEALQKGDVDVLSGPLPTKMRGFVQKKIYEEPLCFAVGPNHPLAKAGSVLWTDLIRYPWVIPSTGSAFRGWLESELATNKVELPTHCVQSASVTVHQSLLIETDMITVFPRLFLRYELKNGLARILPVEPAPKKRTFGVTFARGREHDPLIEWYITYFRREVEAASTYLPAQGYTA